MRTRHAYVFHVPGYIDPKTNWGQPGKLKTAGLAASICDRRFPAHKTRYFQLIFQLGTRTLEQLLPTRSRRTQRPLRGNGARRTPAT